MKHLKTYNESYLSKIGKIKSKLVKKIIKSLKKCNISLFIPESIKINGCWVWSITLHDNDELEVLYFTKDGDEIYKTSDEISVESIYLIYNEIKDIDLEKLIELAIGIGDDTWIFEIINKNKNKIDFSDFYEGYDIVDTHLNYPYVLDEIFIIYEVQKYIMDHRHGNIKWLIDKHDIDDKIKEEYKNIFEADKMGLM